MYSNINNIIKTTNISASARKDIHTHTHKNTHIHKTIFKNKLPQVTKYLRKALQRKI